MSHNEKRKDWKREFAYAAVTGFLYGATNTIVGHPFDTIKTKMQTQSEHMGSKTGYIQTIKNVFLKEGPIGFYRGCIPPFWGSIIYRSAQFSIYEAVYTRLKDNAEMCNEIPGFLGIEYRTLLAGFIAASSRAFIECPFEYAKVKG